jgi:tetratricopeptide (TPR) repeat protein
MMGENEYRRSRFVAALDFYRRALAADSLLAMAALKGAWAASWEHETLVADTMIAAALAHERLLPERHALYAHGLQYFQTGQADSAIAKFEAVLQHDQHWVEGWMALGETYHHLVLNMAAWDSAEAAFDSAASIDPDFAPALLHLSDHMLWRGELERAEQLLARFGEVASDPEREASRRLRLRCVRDGPASLDWRAAAEQSPGDVLAAATWLAGSGSYPACAERAYLALLAVDGVGSQRRWGARLGLQSLYMAQARYDEMRTVLDGAQQDVLPSTRAMYLLDAAAGAPVEDRAAEVAAARCTDPPTTPGPVLWLCSVWAHHIGDADLSESIRDALVAQRDSRGSRRDSLLADIGAAYAALVVGDSAAALDRFRALRTTGSMADLAWQPWEPLGAERVQLARLLFARGEYDEAYRVAETLEHPEPVVYLMYLPESLELRAEVADATGRHELALQIRRRQQALSQESR